MRCRAGTVADIPALWALRTRCVRETCSTHYPPDVITRWAASAAPVQFQPLVEAGAAWWPKMRRERYWVMA